MSEDVKLDESPIFFWTQKEFACFSNFHPSPIEVDGKIWLTVEHYFQAMKTLDESERESIRLATSPKEAKKLGGKCNLRPDWEEIKFDVMLAALRAKFSDEKFRKVLLDSGVRPIYEDSPWDSEWGTGELGGIGTGNNKLGKALMQVRNGIELDKQCDEAMKICEELCKKEDFKKAFDEVKTICDRYGLISEVVMFAGLRPDMTLDEFVNALDAGMWEWDVC